jgi:hypothetical protein
MRRKPTCRRLAPHSNSVLKSERVKGSLRRFAPLTRGDAVPCVRPQAAKRKNPTLLARVRASGKTRLYGKNNPQQGAHLLHLAANPRRA